MNQTAEKYHWLDWARFFAAFWVLVVHARSSNWNAYGDLHSEAQTWPVAIFFAVTRLGYEAVIFFFVLSGFLVGGKLLERCLDKSFDVSAYALDRVTRIYVPLVPAVIFSAILAVFRSKQVDLSTVIGNLLGLQGVLVRSVPGNEPLWSLAYETWFYVMAGSLGFALTGHRNRAGAVVLLTVSMLVFTVLDPVLLMTWWLGASHYTHLRVHEPSWRI